MNDAPTNNPETVYKLVEHKPKPVGQADTRFDPSDEYDGPMFLQDRPVYLDFNQVPVTEVVRIHGPAGFVSQTRPMQKSYNKLYNQGQPQ